MTNVDLARVEFAFVTINHFFFVPITIGLAFLTALLQTAWYRSGRDDYLRLTSTPAVDRDLVAEAPRTVGRADEIDLRQRGRPFLLRLPESADGGNP
jgi:hypothetical protein